MDDQTANPLQDNEIAIRRALPDDVPAITACVKAAYRHYISRIGQPPAPMKEDYNLIVAHDLAFVALKEGLIVGFLALKMEEGRIRLDSVAVLPRFQGLGLGRRLIGLAETQAKEGGFSEPELYTNEAMVENIRLYTRLGFKEADRREEDGYRRVYMRKSL